MSEWDYLPTPYETLVESETKHSLLIVMSIGCLLEGRVIHPIDVFEIAEKHSDFNILLFGYNIWEEKLIPEIEQLKLQYDNSKKFFIGDSNK